VLDPPGDAAQRIQDPRPFALEAPWPGRVGINDHDRATLAATDQHLIQVGVQIVAIRLRQCAIASACRRFDVFPSVTSPLRGRGR
jgi:hypothetical protein